jgi:hypothetical protein
VNAPIVKAWNHHILLKASFVMLIASLSIALVLKNIFTILIFHVILQLQEQQLPPHYLCHFGVEGLCVQVYVKK